MLDLMQWSATALTVLGCVLLARKSAWGWASSITSCAVWGLYAYLTQQWGLLTVEAVVAAAGVYGIAQWGNDSFDARIRKKQRDHIDAELGELREHVAHVARLRVRETDARLAETRQRQHAELKAVNAGVADARQRLREDKEFQTKVEAYYTANEIEKKALRTVIEDLKAGDEEHDAGSPVSLNGKDFCCHMAARFVTGISGIRTDVPYPCESANFVESWGDSGTRPETEKGTAVPSKKRNKEKPVNTDILFRAKYCPWCGTVHENYR